MVNRSSIIYHKQKESSKSSICGISASNIFLDKHSRMIVEENLTLIEVLNRSRFDKEEIEFCQKCLFRSITTY